MDNNQCGQSRINHAVPQKNKHRLIQSHEASRIDGGRSRASAGTNGTREYVLVVLTYMKTFSGGVTQVITLRVPISYLELCTE